MPQKRFDSHVDQAGNRARGVVGMERAQHQMSGQCCLDRDFSRLEVADFADHDDVGVLPEERSQAGCKREADIVLYLSLIDAEEVVFDRIFGGHDIYARLVEHLQCRVKGCGFAASGWSGYQNHAVGFLEAFHEVLQGLFFKAELGQVKLEISFVENAENDFFAKKTRKG